MPPTDAMPASPIVLIGQMTPMDWAFVGIASAIVFAILGKKMARDIAGWLR
jgi:hypothetical protein